MMKISVFLLDEWGHNVDGWIQIDDLFDSTADGVGLFTLPAGAYTVRGIAYGYRIENIAIEVKEENQEFTLLAKRG